MFRSSVRAYHGYRDDWVPVRGETLQCFCEVGNTHNLYAVTVTKAEPEFPLKVALYEMVTENYASSS